MSFKADVFKVLIASPGDVIEERHAIPEIISRWNNTNAESSNLVLLPVKWETSTAPLMGDRPQGIINDQMVKSCDMAIGVFWTRLGSPTGASQSGTAEEIEWFIENGKPVMVYFSSQKIDPTKIDLEQYKNVRDFEKKMQKLGLTGSYNSIEDFKEKLFDQLSQNVRNILQGTPTTKTPDEIKAEIRTFKKVQKDGQVYFEDYAKDGVVKSFVVKGDTKTMKDALKEKGGRWNRTLGGWVFPKTREIEIAELIKGNA